MSRQLLPTSPVVSQVYWPMGLATSRPPRSGFLVGFNVHSLVFCLLNIIYSYILREISQCSRFEPLSTALSPASLCEPVSPFTALPRPCPLLSLVFVLSFSLELSLTISCTVHCSLVSFLSSRCFHIRHSLSSFSSIAYLGLFPPPSPYK